MTRPANQINQGPANFSSKGSDSEYFWLFRIDSLWGNSLTMPLSGKQPLAMLKSGSECTLIQLYLQKWEEGLDMTQIAGA